MKIRSDFEVGYGLDNIYNSPISMPNSGSIVFNTAKKKGLIKKNQTVPLNVRIKSDFLW